MKKTFINAMRIGAAPLAICVASLASPALAQDAPDCGGDTGVVCAESKDSGNVIIVTGSIVRNASAATASPVVSVSADDMQTRGISTVAETLQTLSANNAGTAQPSWSSLGFASGASAPSLRGLNDAYTLTLFNGMRSALYPLGDDGYRNFVDINSIPASIVDRVDVLLDGASATYGSDAIAGVVNVLVKRQIQGLHADASFGESMKQGDAREYRASATYGYGDLDEQGFNIFANFEYQKNARLLLTERPRGNKSFFTDLGGVCGSAAQGCLFNGVSNGIQYDGTYAGLGSTQAPLFRPYDSTFNSLGRYRIRLGWLQRPFVDYVDSHPNWGAQCCHASDPSGRRGRLPTGPVRVYVQLPDQAYER